MTSRALSHEDVLLEILRHFALNRQDRRDPDDRIRAAELRSVLAACATVNSALSECALGYLWRSLDTVDPVLDILTYPHLRDSDVDHVIHESAWRRLRKYARLVRELRAVDELELDPTRRATWLAVAERLNGEPLFPLLRRLELVVTVRPGVPSLCLLVLSPSIRVLELDLIISSRRFSHSRGLVNTVLASLSSTVSPRPDIYGALPQVTRHLQAIAPLTDLCILDTRTDGIDQPTMQVLTTLKSLRKLSCYVCFGATTHSHIPCRRRGFTALEILHLRGPLPYVHESLQMVSESRRLHRCRFELLDQENPIVTRVDLRPLEEFLDTLRCVAAGVSSLVLQTSYKHAVSVAFGILLRPMLFLSNMEELECPFAPSDEDITSLAAAWPRLRSLAVYTNGSRDGAPAITLPALLHLSSLCPQLEYLSFPKLNVQHLPDPDSIPRLGQSLVGRISFRNSMDEANLSGAELSKLAALVDRIFPRLDFTNEHPYGCGKGSPDSSALCDRVFHILSNLRASKGRPGEADDSAFV
ncbi:hypothetical protein K466DRAFT_663144 [Polyporus arcularius HHB13444]|uniref:F-box domain-containing protein n=1 Tax=Polyporus arcularius HHB13444 TaxID=1314778 RepID=A0A5C3PD80_9APHY|nr:hypothetical protein K466DRAFT_663144 [Polyporus arcularius HHB13444]